MHLADLIADEKQMTKQDQQRWLDRATSLSIADFTVPWVAAESAHGHELGKAHGSLSKKRKTIRC